MKRLYRKFKSEDKGAALALVGASLILLMGMAAFGTDLAWFYLNSSRIQRAADAAALGGVVWLPGDEPASFSTARAIATQNGYTDDLGVTTDVEPARITGELNQLEVTIRNRVDTFFLKIFGFQHQWITETGRAEYIPPLKLGSPSNKFGNDPSCYSTNTDCAGNFWANIHGTRTDTGMGDAYSSYCNLGAGSNNTCGQNPQYRPTGYLYGLIPNGNAVTIQTLDLNFHNKSGTVMNGDDQRTGDHNNFCGDPIACIGQEVTVNVYAPDPTPLDISDNPLVCSETYTPMPQFDPDDDPPFVPTLWDYWDDVCGGSINTASQPNGIWVVQIVANSGGGRTTVLGAGDQNNSGLNRYSIRTDTGNLFALGDFSIFNNASGSNTNFYLAEVPDYYAGKTFVVEMYDTGESAATGTLQPVDPLGNVFDDGECRIYSRTITGNWSLNQTIPAGNACQESVSPSEYHGRWLKFEMDLPVGYACGANCWWKINYAYPSAVNDTTTWRAYMIGNPIHLVP
ncbi:MAG: pilus assembly protein TadG-related protein [Acidimicrobiia bacterium]